LMGLGLAAGASRRCSTTTTATRSRRRSVVVTRSMLDARVGSGDDLGVVRRHPPGDRRRSASYRSIGPGRGLGDDRQRPTVPVTEMVSGTADRGRRHRPDVAIASTGREPGPRRRSTQESSSSRLAAPEDARAPGGELVTDRSGCSDGGANRCRSSRIRATRDRPAPGLKRAPIEGVLNRARHRTAGYEPAGPVGRDSPTTWGRRAHRYAKWRGRHRVVLRRQLAGVAFPAASPNIGGRR